MNVFTPIKERATNGGYQKIYRFENNYGASVVEHSFSYGLELAVIEFDGDEWSLTYETPITDDVIGYLDEEKMNELLQQISEL